MVKHSRSHIKWFLPSYREQTGAAKRSLKPTLTQPRLDRYLAVSAEADDATSEWEHHCRQRPARIAGSSPRHAVVLA